MRWAVYHSDISWQPEETALACIPCPVHSRVEDCILRFGQCTAAVLRLEWVPFRSGRPAGRQDISTMVRWRHGYLQSAAWMWLPQVSYLSQMMVGRLYSLNFGRQLARVVQASAYVDGQQLRCKL